MWNEVGCRSVELVSVYVNFARQNPSAESISDCIFTNDIGMRFDVRDVHSLEGRQKGKDVGGDVEQICRINLRQALEEINRDF